MELQPPISAEERDRSSMNSASVARAVAADIRRDMPEELVDVASSHRVGEFWPGDHLFLLRALLENRSNLRQLREAADDAVKDHRRVELPQSEEDLLEWASEPAHWRLVAYGLRDGYEFRLWSYGEARETLTFLLVRKGGDLTVLELSD